MRIWRQELELPGEPSPASFDAVVVRRLANRAWVMRPGQGGALRVLRGYRKIGWVFNTWRPEFQQEAWEKIGSLEHGNLVRIFELGLGYPNFVVHEYIEGVSLETLTLHDDLPLDIALYIASETANALQYLHEHYGAHEAISPHQIYVSNTGDIQLLGYEKKQVVHSEESDIAEIPPHRPHQYISPERLFEDRIDAQSDLFALTECLWTWITGQNPFVSGPCENEYQRLAQRMAVFRGERPLPRLPAAYTELQRVLWRGMHFDSSQRFPSMAAFRRSLVAAHPFHREKVRGKLSTYMQAEMSRLRALPVQAWTNTPCW